MGSLSHLNCIVTYRECEMTVVNKYSSQETYSLFGILYTWRGPVGKLCVSALFSVQDMFKEDRGTEGETNLVPVLAHNMLC